jgi:signal transduction histidine kinase
VQVFLNLVLNAIDATGKGGRIEVSAEQSGDCLELTIRDDGHGVSAADAKRLFEPYFTNKKHGTGLGLFVSRKLIADHGGTIDFASTANEGTTFRIRLPLECPANVLGAKETASTVVGVREPAPDCERPVPCLPQ